MSFSSLLSLCFLLLRSAAMELSILLLCLAAVTQYLNLRTQPIINWPILGHLPALLHNLHHLHDWLSKALKDLSCGTFVFKGPIFARLEIVCTCDPQNVEYMMKKNFPNFHKGPQFAEILDFLGDGMFIADGESWAIQRKMAVPRFISKRFQSFYTEKSREVVMNGLLPVLQHGFSKGLTLNLQDVFKRLAFDATCASVLGRSTGFLSVGVMENEFSKALDTMTRVAFIRHCVPSFLWKMMGLMGVGWERHYKLAWQVIDDELTKYISMKKKDVADGITSDDLLTTYMIRSREGDDQEEQEAENSMAAVCTETFLRDTTLSFIFAGLDTISSGLTWFFWVLSKSSSVEAKIIEELKLIFMLKEKNNANEPILMLSSLEDLTKLIYLEAAILESMRLYPPVPIEHKSAKKADVLPDGTMVRPGMIILYSLYAMGRMEWIWGDDCSDFRPERWIDQKGNLKHESASRYPVFNVGPRACLGKRMALTMMKMVIAAILLNFQVLVVEGQSISPAPSIILKMEKGLKVTLTNRI